MICSICAWVHIDFPERAKEPVTVINGQAVCHGHMEAASLGRDHRHAATLAGAKL